MKLSGYRPALLTTLRAGYGRPELLKDISAGMLVGVVALPLSMALAIASGCKPEQGLWTAIIGGFIISLLGGSRVQIGGPAGAFVGLCAVGVNQFGYEGLALATIMSGFFIFVMGWARLGQAVSFIPMPVVIGFTSGIALILCSTQIGPALGLPETLKPAEHVHERLVFIWLHIHEWNYRALLVCGVTMMIIIGLRRISVQIPSSLLGVIIMTLFVSYMGWDAPIKGSSPSTDTTLLDTIASRYGGIPAMLPAPTIPGFGLSEQATLLDYANRIRELSSLALAIALLGAIESLLSAVVCDGMTGYRHDSNSELIGQGLANMISPLFMGLPATGVIARSSTNVRAGATSPLAGIFHAMVVLIIMVCAAPLVGHIPMASLAGVLLVVCWYMAELRHWPHILKAGRSDAFLLPVAFFLTAFVGLTEAILVGVTLAMFFFVKRMSDLTEIHHTHKHAEHIRSDIPPGVKVYTVRGAFFFGAATRIRDLESDSDVKVALVLRLEDVPFIDATAAFSLRELANSFHKKGSRLMICDISERVSDDLHRHHLVEYLGIENVHRTFEDVMTILSQAGEKK